MVSLPPDTSDTYLHDNTLEKVHCMAHPAPNWYMAEVPNKTGQIVKHSPVNTVYRL